MNVEPIGIVKSPVKEAVDENWGNVVAEIHLLDSMASGLQGIEQFSHLIVVFFMHQSIFDMALVGTFAQRARHRPNPIGVTTVELLEVKQNVVKVKGLDAIDGTPVLDLKPYLPAWDCRLQARIPEWVERLMQGYF